MDVNVRNFYGETVLFSYHCNAVIQYFIDKGVDINATSIIGENVLDRHITEALRCRVVNLMLGRNLDVDIELLLKHGIKVTKHNLILARQSKIPRVFLQLLKVYNKQKAFFKI